MKILLKYVPALLLLSLCQPAAAKNEVIVGNVRVQLLSDSLVRLEAKGAGGFEDRLTFHVVDRGWKGVPFKRQLVSGEVVLTTANYSVHVPQNAASLAGSYVANTSGQMLYRFDGALSNSVWLPGPSDNPAVWSFADTPRAVPPKWGATPAPSTGGATEHSGWDLGNDAPDVYVFVPKGDYRRLRKDYLKLTGPTEMPPLYVFGAFDSRWYDYSEQTALQQIDDYRAHQIPLDVLVIDTGWRVGASIGYAPNTNLFPDMARFIKEAHDKNVRLMFNDHPEPQSPDALSATEMNYRFDGLSGLLKAGLDIWWFDRNWSVALGTPLPNLRKEVWGMKLYHDITAQVKPEQRPIIMANVDGIDNGIHRHPMDVAAHRYAIQWTGDTQSHFDYLRRGVENAVNAGVRSLFPYASEDLGGHVGNPPRDQYIRWVEYGALSPVYRPHCGHNGQRMPWAFGPEAEQVARRFLNLRYRLLPLFYAAAHENHETGEPLMRRVDLDYPQFPDARREDQYLLGNSILVAPVVTSSNANSATARPLWLPPGGWINAWTGQSFAGPTNIVNMTPLDQVPLFIKAGAVVPLAPEMQFTGEKPWTTMTLDVYPGAEAAHATIYEDDTLTVNYKKGEFRNTLVTASSDNQKRTVRVKIGAAQGNFKGALKERVWKVRVHITGNWMEDAQPTQVMLNGKKSSLPIQKLARVEAAMPLGDAMGAPDGDVFELTLPSTRAAKATEVEIRF